MQNMNRVETTLIGTLIGPIWQPGYICEKEIEVNLSDLRGRIAEPVGSFNHMLDLHVTNDGDFQSCKLSRASYLRLRISRRNGNVVLTRTKFVDLKSLPSADDYLEPV